MTINLPYENFIENVGTKILLEKEREKKSHDSVSFVVKKQPLPLAAFVPHRARN